MKRGSRLCGRVKRGRFVVRLPRRGSKTRKGFTFICLLTGVTRPNSDGRKKDFSEFNLNSKPPILTGMEFFCCVGPKSPLLTNSQSAHLANQPSQLHLPFLLKSPLDPASSSLKRRVLTTTKATPHGMQKCAADN